MAGICFVVALLRPADEFLYAYLTVSMIFAAMLFAQRGVWMTLGANLIFLMGLPLLGGSNPYADPLVPMFLVVLAALLLLGLRHRDSIERVRQAEIAASADRFRSLFHASPLAMVLSRRSDGCFINVNRAFEQWSGMSSAQLIGRTSTELGFVNDEARTRSVKMIQERGSVSELELQVRISSGDVREVLASVAPLILDGEECLLSTLVDVTTRKHTESALRASESRLRAVISNVPVVLYTLDRDGIFQLSEGKGLEVLGLQPGEVVGRSVFEMYRDYPEICTAIRRAIAGEHVVHVAQLGSLMFEVHYSPTVGSDGRVDAVIGLAIDISERMRAEQTLRDGELRYRQLFENMTSGFALHEIICNAQGRPIDYRYIEANPAFEKLTGVPVASLVGKRIREVLPNTEDYWIETFGKVALTGEPIAYENYSRELGKYYDTWVFSPRKNQFAVIFTDITRRKIAEAESHNLNVTLERRVKERTAELERANKELEAFSYSVSHDLRAPLRAIDGFSRALLEDYASRLDEVALGHLSRVRNGVQRLGTLIDDLLELSRIGRAAMNLTTVDLSSVAVEVVAQLRDGEPNRVIEVDIAPNLSAHGDARLLRLVLENLLGNAWKYTGRTDPARIRFYATPQDGEIVFRIDDNGAGFDMQYANKLFGAFQRLHGKEFAGSGIGLVTVARIIHRHGGRVWAQGEVGKGASFFFTVGNTI